MLRASTLKFLKDLKKNNNKPWFEKNKSLYLDAKEDAEHFVEQLIEGFGKSDTDISALLLKDCTYRIYRDVRFSGDKTPYKTHMGAYLNKGGKKMPTAGYYFHLEPGRSMTGGGLWMPMAPELGKVRQEIDYNYAAWTKILGDRRFKKFFPDGLEQGEILSRPPKGYDAENPAIGFLKLKSFVVLHKLTDEQVLSRSLLKEVLNTFEAMKEFVHFLNRSLE
ncbi:MAG TPA: DUF2461 domain-containing protein [Puia sp.]|jgi:uncharacterized protein (TIGR02453 family)|nr:DUF2461 domain-containing protein [Puia sp.]